jgi:hypothetical protein
MTPDSFFASSLWRRVLGKPAAFLLPVLAPLRLPGWPWIGGDRVPLSPEEGMIRPGKTDLSIPRSVPRREAL